MVTPCSLLYPPLREQVSYVVGNILDRQFLRSNANWIGEASRVGGWHCKQLSWDLQKVQHIVDFTDIYKAQGGTDKYIKQVATFYQGNPAIMNNWANKLSSTTAIDVVVEQRDRLLKKSVRLLHPNWWQGSTNCTRQKWCYVCIKSIFLSTHQKRRSHLVF